MTTPTGRRQRKYVAAKTREEVHRKLLQLHQTAARGPAAGVPVVSVHSTRHVCASLLVELEVHPRVAMQVLRHSRIGVTMDIYSQVAAAGTRDALSRLGSLLSE